MIIMAIDGGYRILLFIMGLAITIAGVLLWADIATNASAAGGLGSEYNVAFFPFLPFLLGLAMMVIALTNKGGS